MSPALISRLSGVLVDAARAGAAALSRWGVPSQERMAVEECGELLVAMSQWHRQRATSEQVIEECADVLVTVMQVAIAHGRGDVGPLADAVARKVRRLNARLEGRDE